MFVPNARVSILRGTFTDDFEDVHDTVDPVAIDVPMSIVTRSQRVVSPETGRSYVIDAVQGIARRNVDVRKGDRIRDQVTLLTYVVDAVISSGVFIPPDKQLTMRQLDA